jgi:hypothetical protein
MFIFGILKKIMDAPGNRRSAIGDRKKWILLFLAAAAARLSYRRCRPNATRAVFRGRGCKKARQLLQ